MKIKENRIRELIREEVERASNSPNFNRLGRWDHWQDFTSLYNINYRKFHNEDGFERVEYNEPSNIVLIRPLPGTFSKNQPVALFGVKSARGIHKDMRELNSTDFGVKPVTLKDEEYDKFHQNTYEAVREVNPIYLLNFGLMDPTMDLEDEDQDEFNRRKTNSRVISYNSRGS